MTTFLLVLILVLQSSQKDKTPKEPKPNAALIAADKYCTSDEAYQNINSDVLKNVVRTYCVRGFMEGRAYGAKEVINSRLGTLGRR